LNQWFIETRAIIAPKANNKKANQWCAWLHVE